MPIYEYECDSCGHRFEEFQSIKDAPLKICPVCSEEKVRRLISGGTGLIFKGSGFYITDYKNSHVDVGSNSGNNGHSNNGKKNGSIKTEDKTNTEAQKKTDDKKNKKED